MRFLCVGPPSPTCPLLQYRTYSVFSIPFYLEVPGIDFRRHGVLCLIQAPPRLFGARSSVNSAGCLDGSGDYVMTVPDVEPSESYKIR